MSDRLPDTVPPNHTFSRTEAAKVSDVTPDRIDAAINAGTLKTTYSLRAVTAIRGRDLAAWLTREQIQPETAAALANDDEAYPLMEAARKAGITRDALSRALDARAIRFVRIHRPVQCIQATHLAAWMLHGAKTTVDSAARPATSSGPAFVIPVAPAGGAR
jgi:hypothetical protein